MLSLSAEKRRREVLVYTLRTKVMMNGKELSALAQVKQFKLARSDALEPAYKI